MWARDFEVFFAIWLSISWLIFNYTDSSLMYHDFTIAILISIFSLLSYKYVHIHLLNFIVSFWLISFVLYTQAPVTDAIYQNYMVIGLLLLMFTVVPSYASDPSVEWEEFKKNKKK